MCFKTKNTNMCLFTTMSTRCKYGFILPLIILLYSCNEQSNKVSFTQKEIEDSVFVSDDSLNIIKPLSKSAITLYLEQHGLQDIQQMDSSIVVDLKYSTTDNFTKTILYDSLYKAFLHPIAAEKLIKAQILLKEFDSSLSLLVYDAARPMSVQKKMYAIVQNTPYHAYVANPSRTGMHNYGMAVDITICNEDNTPLDMGTPFDFFGRAAGINKEDQLVSEGVLTREQVENRGLLRRIMLNAGFIAIRGEWWHFNASTLEYAKSNVPLIK